MSHVSAHFSDRFYFWQMAGNSNLSLWQYDWWSFVVSFSKNFFSELIKKKFAKKISKFINFFKKNELVYFMCFRLIGGGGTPFPIQNVLPVIFNMSIKNYIVATSLGIVPATFVAASLGSGIEGIIDQNAKLSFASAFLSPEIYLPIIGFSVILIVAFVIKKYFFKQ